MGIACDSLVRWGIWNEFGRGSQDDFMLRFRKTQTSSSPTDHRMAFSIPMPILGIHSGCRELFDAVMRVRPKLHVFGHVHGAYGIFQTEHTTFVNAALLGIHGGLDKPPLVFRMTRR